MKAGPVKTIGGYLIGQIVKHPDGFRFLPAMSSHRPSRKAHATADKCLPLWAKKLAGKY